MNEHLMLAGLSQKSKTGEEIVNDSLRELPFPELLKLASDADPLSVSSHVDVMVEKISQAERHGRELAHENSSLEKIAFLGAALSAGSKLAPLAKGLATNMAISGIANKAMGVLKPAAPAASAMGEVAGGFKYAALALPGNLLQRAAGYAVRNPGTAVTAAGALTGAAFAPRDPQTGQKNYLRGAVMGGVGAAGVNALSGGALANRMRSSVMNRNNPLLGQGTRQYFMDAAAAGKGKIPVGGKYTRGAPNAAPPTAVTGQAPEPVGQYTGGPTMGNVKLANAQTLTYDPASKTFTQQHLSGGSQTQKAFAPRASNALNSLGNLASKMK